MAFDKKKQKSQFDHHIPVEKKTTIGKGKNSRPLNKHKRRMTKKYRRQGR